jgi:hypothetical protein
LGKGRKEGEPRLDASTGEQAGGKRKRDERRHRQVKRVFLIFVVATIAAALSVGTATADPVNNPQAIPVTFTCDGEPVTLVIRPFHGASAFVVGDTDVLLAKSGTLVLTNLETGEQQTFTFANPGKGIEEGELVTCTATYTFGGFFWDVTVQAVRTPRGG